MRLSKAWYALVVLAAALAAALVILLPRVLQGEVDRQALRHLETARVGAAQILELHSRRWLDATVHAAADAQLVESLDQASRGGNLELLHRTIQDRLRGFNAQWKAHRVIAVDLRGRVIARAGGEEDFW